MLISAFGTLETALEAVKAGAFDYVSKPVDIGQVREVVARALARRARAGRSRAATFPAGRAAPDGLVGRSGGHARGLQADRARLRLRRTGAGDGRDRHRQGARGARDPQERRARPAAVRARQLRRAARGAARVGAVRPRARRLHRRRRRQARALRGGARRHALPRRDRRDVAGAAGAAPARARDGRGAPRRLGARDERRRARDRGHPPRPRARGARGPLPRGPLLPAARVRGPACRRCASGARTSRCSPRTSWRASPRAAGERPRSRRAPSRRSPPTTGRATCASSRTRWSGWSPRRAAGRSTSPTCRLCSASGAPRSRSRSSPGCRASRSWRSATCATCWPRSRATAAARPRCWGSTGARSTAWPSASGSTSTTKPTPPRG